MIVVVSHLINIYRTSVQLTLSLERKCECCFIGRIKYRRKRSAYNTNSIRIMSVPSIQSLLPHFTFSILNTATVASHHFQTIRMVVVVVVVAIAFVVTARFFGSISAPCIYRISVLLCSHPRKNCIKVPPPKR